MMALSSQIIRAYCSDEGIYAYSFVQVGLLAQSCIIILPVGKVSCNFKYLLEFQSHN